IGRLFREFAVTLAIAIGVSAVLSLTLTAMMCAHLLKPRGEEREGRLAHTFEAGFARMLAAYERTLKWVLSHQPGTLAITLATLIVTALLALAIPKGFFPLQDTGLVVGFSVAPADASFRRMSTLQGAASAGEDARAAAARRRRQRRGIGRAAAAHQRRPRHGLEDGDLPADHRRHALRRFRTAAGHHHLHPAQPVPRDPGDGTADGAA